MCLICRFLLHVCICLHICSNVKWTAAPLSALSYCLVLLMFYLVSSFLNLFQQSEVEMTSPLQGYRIQVSNLHPNVSHEDITVCISYDDITWAVLLEVFKSNVLIKMIHDVYFSWYPGQAFYICFFNFSPDFSWNSYLSKATEDRTGYPPLHAKVKKKEKNWPGGYLTWMDFARGVCFCSLFSLPINTAMSMMCW